MIPPKQNANWIKTCTTHIEDMSYNHPTITRNSMDLFLLRYGHLPINRVWWPCPNSWLAILQLLIIIEYMYIAYPTWTLFQWCNFTQDKIHESPNSIYTSTILDIGISHKSNCFRCFVSNPPLASSQTQTAPEPVQMWPWSQSPRYTHQPAPLHDADASR